MARHFNHHRKYTACSLQDHLHTMKVNTTPNHPSFASVHLFQSNQCFEAVEFVNRHVLEKL